MPRPLASVRFAAANPGTFDDTVPAPCLIRYGSCVVVLLCLLGCSKSAPPADTASPPAAPAIDQSTNDFSSDSVSGAAADATAAANSDDTLPEPLGAGSGAMPAAELPAPPLAVEPLSDAQTALQHGGRTVAPPLQLPPELPPPRLIAFLRDADQEMQGVASGRRPMADQAAATAEMTRLSRLKHEAAKQLIERSADGSNERLIGFRAQLQSLSHLAALGDLPAAKELEVLALEQSQSDDLALALDSRLVLMGLAMERLRNGVTTDASELLALVDQIAQAPQTPDVSALMVMGQSLAMLKEYGDQAAAEQIRQTIVKLFGEHPNPDIAAMASGFANLPAFFEAEEALRGHFQDQPLEPAHWRAVVGRLLDQSPNRDAIGFLASAALQFEAADQAALEDATFDAAKTHTAVSGDLAAELELAIAARQIRRQLVGQMFQFDGPSVDGRPLSMTSYTGSVVLMPFWAIAMPESLMPLQLLDEIRQRHGSSVAIVGMNLDTVEAPAAEFLRESPVVFRSFQSVTSSGGGNEVARRYGVVSLPFLLVIDQHGKIAAVSLTGHQLAETVDGLLQP